MSDHTGRCLCGAVRYLARGTPKSVSNCHCAMCRRASGGPFITFARYAEDQVEFTSGAPAWYRSSEDAERGFCPSCGGSLAYREAKRSDSIWLTVAMMDNPRDLAPQYHIFTDSMLPWLRIDDDLPRHGQWPTAHA
ncbi:MAG: GFA family protein [Alphaproteobacteria bacterium]|nr:GFA family protein [Alphaproteobacteria bacterium]